MTQWLYKKATVIMPSLAECRWCSSQCSVFRGRCNGKHSIRYRVTVVSPLNMNWFLVVLTFANTPKLEWLCFLIFLISPVACFAHNHCFQQKYHSPAVSFFLQDPSRPLCSARLHWTMCCQSKEIYRFAVCVSQLLGISWPFLFTYWLTICLNWLMKTLELLLISLSVI